MDPTTRLDGHAFDDAMAELVQNLATLRTWLAEHEHDGWAHELERDLDLLHRSQGHGLDRFLGHFGSMGSLGDVGAREIESVLGRAYLLASVLRRSLSD